MAWQDNMVIMLRGAIGDDGDTPRYSNDRLVDVLVTGAVFVITSINFRKATYTVDVATQTISPDPVGMQDNDMMILTVLRSACIIAKSEHRNAAQKAVSFKDGPATVDLREAANQLKAWADSLDAEYKDAVVTYKTGHGLVGRAIVTPATYWQYTDNMTTSSVGDETSPVGDTIRPRFS